MDLALTLEEADLEVDSVSQSRSSSNSLPRHPSSNSLNFLSEHSNNSLSSPNHELSPHLPPSRSPSPPNEPTEMKYSNTPPPVLPVVISSVGSVESKNSSLYDQSTTRAATDSPQFSSRSGTITPTDDRDRTISAQRLSTTIIIHEEMTLRAARSPTPDASAIPAASVASSVISIAAAQPSPRPSRSPRTHSHSHSHYRGDDLSTVNIHESPQQARITEQQLQAEHEERSAYHRLEENKSKVPHSRPIDVSSGGHLAPQAANNRSASITPTAATRHSFMRGLFGAPPGSTTPTSIASRSITPASASASTSTPPSTSLTSPSHAHSLPSAAGLHLPPPALPQRSSAVHGSASFSHFTGAAAAGPKLPRSVDDDDDGSDDGSAHEIYVNSPHGGSFPETPATPSLSHSSPSLSLRFNAQNKPLALRQAPFTALISTYGIVYLFGCAIAFFGLTFGSAYLLLRPLDTLGVWTATYSSSHLPLYADLLVSLFGLVFVCSILSTPLLYLFISHGWIIPVDEVLLASGVWRIFPLTVKGVWRRSFLMAIELMVVFGGLSLVLLMIGCNSGWLDQENMSSTTTPVNGQSSTNMNDSGFGTNEQHCSVSGSEYMWMKSIWAVVLSVCVFPLVFLSSLNRHTLPSKIYSHFLSQHHLNFHDVANTGN